MYAATHLTPLLSS